MFSCNSTKSAINNEHVTLCVLRSPITDHLNILLQCLIIVIIVCVHKSDRVKPFLQKGIEIKAAEWLCGWISERKAHFFLSLTISVSPSFLPPACIHYPPPWPSAWEGGVWRSPGTLTASYESQRESWREGERDADGEEEKSRVHIQGLMHVNVEVLTYTIHLKVCIPPFVATAVKSRPDLFIKGFFLSATVIYI